MDPRYQKLASVLIHHSTRLKKGENLLLHALGDVPADMINAITKAVHKVKGNMYLRSFPAGVLHDLIAGASLEQLKLNTRLELEEMKNMDAYIAIRASDRELESAGIPEEKLKLAEGFQRIVMDQRVNETKWVVLRWPTAFMAKKANQNLKSFERFYFDVCTFDYSKFGEGVKVLQQLMKDTDKVHIKGKNVDLKFSIKKIGAVICEGLRNIPDGEVYSAPVKNSVEGWINYNTESSYSGSSFNNVKFVFKKGKIVKASSNNNKKINNILDRDAGARYIGEFAIGFNPFISTPMGDTLFDEKIFGSFHFTPGQCYKKANNGNSSSVHWDLVMIQRPEYGGGEIWFDDVLIRKDGRFVAAKGSKHEKIKLLNPEYLKGEWTKAKALSKDLLPYKK